MSKTAQSSVLMMDEDRIPATPWFGEEMTLSVNDHSYRAGYAALFNL